MRWLELGLPNKFTLVEGPVVAEDAYHLLWTAAKETRSTSAVIFTLISYIFTIARPASVSIDMLMAYSLGLVPVTQAAESFCVLLLFLGEVCVVFKALYFYRLFRNGLNY